MAIDLYPKTYFFSLVIAIYSYRKRSLQVSGAAAANLIGYLSLANPNGIFGVALLTFFIIGSLASKYKRNVKATLVDESNPELQGTTRLSSHTTHHHTLANDFILHQGRDWKQVLCNSWFGTSCAILYRFFPSHHSQHSNPHLSRALVSAALSYWAGCAGDTLASELGILSRSKPRLITNLREVPPGTNGAVSWLGLGFSTLGGLIVGATSSLLGDARGPKLWMMLISGGISGLMCSLFDSFLGAILQQTLYSKTEKRVVATQTSRQLGGRRELVVICGRDWLSNNQVNLISSTATGVLAGFFSYYYFR